MTSREIVTRAIEFKKPERMPISYEIFGRCDTKFVGWNQIGTGDRTLTETYDEWGCLWVRTEEKNMGQIKGHPLSDWSALDTFNWPDPDTEAFYEGMEKKFQDSEDKYILTGIFMLLFERIHSLRGFENTLLDFYLEREKIEALADRIVDYNIKIIKNISERFPEKLQGFHFTDDWGSESALLINPELWREFFKPRYQKIFDAVKEAGWHVWMHSCGRINEIIPDLLALGVDVLNLEQPRALGIEEIGERFAGKVCFSTGCDIQRTMPHEELAYIRREAKLLIDKWATDAGGFILTDDENGDDLGVPLEKRKQMVDAFTEYDRWKHKR